MRLSNITKGVHFNATDINKNMGESLVMHLLMTYYDWQVLKVDYVGADLMALDVKSGKKYAISVKTRDITRESQSVTSYTEQDYKKLCSFTNLMNKNGEHDVIPLVSYVILTKSGHLYCLVINAHDFDAMREEGIVDYGKNGGYSLNVGTTAWDFDVTRIERLLQDDRIAYFDFEVKDMKIAKTNFESQIYNTSDSDLLIGNWNKELGNLGETFVAFLSNMRGRHSFWVNSIGIDHMMVDMNDSGLQYGVSVKSAMKPTEYRFEAKDACNLEYVTKCWGITPEIAIIAMVENSNNEIEKMYCFWMDYNKMIQYADDTLGQSFIKLGQSKGENVYTLTWAGNLLSEIKNEANREKSWIRFYEVQF